MTEIKKVGRAPHWIIYNKTTNSVWKQSYGTYGEAKTEYDFQVGYLRPGQTHGWVIEERY